LKLLKRNDSNNNDNSDGDKTNNAEALQRLEFILRLRLFLFLQMQLETKNIEELKKYLDSDTFKSIFPNLFLNKDFINKIKNILNLPLDKMIRKLNKELAKESNTPLNEITNIFKYFYSKENSEIKNSKLNSNFTSSNSFAQSQQFQQQPKQKSIPFFSNIKQVSSLIKQALFLTIKSFAELPKLVFVEMPKDLFSLTKALRDKTSNLFKSAVSIIKKGINLIRSDKDKIKDKGQKAETGKNTIDGNSTDKASATITAEADVGANITAGTSTEIKGNPETGATINGNLDTGKITMPNSNISQKKEQESLLNSEEQKRRLEEETRREIEEQRRKLEERKRKELEEEQRKRKLERKFKSKDENEKNKQQIKDNEGITQLMKEQAKREEQLKKLSQWTLKQQELNEKLEIKIREVEQDSLAEDKSKNKLKEEIVAEQQTDNNNKKNSLDDMGGGFGADGFEVEYGNLDTDIGCNLSSASNELDPLLEKREIQPTTLFLNNK
jgi:hypothetical protein